MADNIVDKPGNRERLLEGHEDVPLYTIGVTSNLLGCEPSMLRRYEKAGLIEPQRTEGKTRLYSENQLETLREIKELIKDDDVNMAGARIIMELRGEIEDLKEEIESLKDEVTTLRKKLVKEN